MDIMNDSIRIKLGKALEMVSDVKINLDSIEGQELIAEAMHEVVNFPDSERSQKLFEALEAQDLHAHDRVWQKSDAPLTFVYGQDVPDEENFLLDDFEFSSDDVVCLHESKCADDTVVQEHLVVSSDGIIKRVGSAEKVGESSHRHLINFGNFLKVARVAEDLLYCPEENIEEYFLQSPSRVVVAANTPEISAPVRMILNQPDHSSFEISVDGELVTIELRPYALIIHMEPVDNDEYLYLGSNSVVLTLPLDVDDAASSMLERLTVDKDRNYAPAVLHGMVDMFERQVANARRA